MTTDRVLAIAALLGVSSVALGAFGAHGLTAMLASSIDASQRLVWWETAARYHLAHALACGLAAWAHERRGSRASIVSAGSFVIGVLVFSGSLYAMALGAPRWFGAITPIGGVALMVGWTVAGTGMLMIGEGVWRTCFA